MRILQIGLRSVIKHRGGLIIRNNKNIYLTLKVTVVLRLLMEIILVILLTMTSKVKVMFSNTPV